MRYQRVLAISDCAALGKVVPSSPPIAVSGTVALLTGLVVGMVVWTALTSADLVVRAPARVRARTAPQLAFTASSGERIVAQTGGRVTAVLVREGQRVAAGERLATLDDRTAANELARLEAMLTAARQARDAMVRMHDLAADQFGAAQDTRRAELVQARREEARGYSRRSADIALAQTTLDAARRDVVRVLALEADGAASRTQVEQATAKVSEARTRVQAATVAAASGRAEVLVREIAQAERDHAVREQEIAQQLVHDEAELAAAERRVDSAHLELAKTTITTDRGGIVSSVSITPGDFAQPGQAMFVISPETGLRVDAAVAATDVARLAIGMPVRVRVDAFDWQRYGTVTGTISQISPDAEPLAVGAGQTLVYTVRIALDREDIGSDELHGKLKLGMTGTVEVITGRDRLLPLLLGRLHQAISLGGG